MGKSSPSPPPAPDPYQTAGAQAQANAGTAAAQTALNNVNMNTPYGNSFFAQSGSTTIHNPDGSTSDIPTYTEQINLNPAQQHLLNQQNFLGSQANNAAMKGLATANQALANPVTADSLPDLTTSVGATPSLLSGYDQGGQIQNSYASGGQIQSSVPVQQAATSFDNTAGSVQYFQPGDFTAARDAATNAALARLQPSMDQQNSQLQAQLANQGVGLGSSAYGAAMFNQAQQNNDLRLGAVATGDAEQQALFGQQATANQLYNAAQSQDFGQQQARGQFQQAGAAANNASAVAAGQFANAAQSQGEQQNAARAAFGNSAQGQQNAENSAAAGFYNTSALQDYQSRLSGGAFSNQAREQSLNDQESINNNIINQISSLMHGGQVTGFQAPNYSPGTLDQTPLSSDVYQTAALQNQQYMAELQNSAANTAAMGSALGGIFGGFGRKSDRRLKRNIIPLTRARNGLMIYAYEMPTEEQGWHVGMMADEVALVHPEAVWTDPSDGFARVDYARAVA